MEIFPRRQPLDFMEKKSFVNHYVRLEELLINIFCEV